MYGIVIVDLELNFGGIFTLSVHVEEEMYHSMSAVNIFIIVIIIFFVVVTILACSHSTHSIQRDK